MRDDEQAGPGQKSVAPLPWVLAKVIELELGPDCYDGIDEDDEEVEDLLDYVEVHLPVSRHATREAADQALSERQLIDPGSYTVFHISDLVRT